MKLLTLQLYLIISFSTFVLRNVHVYRMCDFSLSCKNYLKPHIIKISFSYLFKMFNSLQKFCKRT